MEQYIIVPEMFVLGMVGKRNGNVEFAARQTKDGQWVCAAQSAEDFPEDFKTLEPLETAELDIANFPEPIIIP